ncbi:MAG: hypothetical protein M0Z59_00700 [Nitrospiraceae bacterium]|nr:hypothetical protein [Nitrospiraceae bacterium]
MFWKKSKKEKEKNTIKAPSPGPAGGKPASDLLLNALDERIKLLSGLLTAADQKIEALEKLIYSAEPAAGKTLSGKTGRKHEILALGKKGLAVPEIARILDMPEGEVELVLNLHPRGNG